MRSHICPKACHSRPKACHSRPKACHSRPIFCGLSSINRPIQVCQARHSPAALWASGWPCFEQPNSQTPLKKITHERLGIGRLRRGFGGRCRYLPNLEQGQRWGIATGPPDAALVGSFAVVTLPGCTVVTLPIRRSNSTRPQSEKRVPPKNLQDSPACAAQPRRLLGVGLALPVCFFLKGTSTFEPFFFQPFLWGGSFFGRLFCFVSL